MSSLAHYAGIRQRRGSVTGDFSLGSTSTSHGSARHWIVASGAFGAFSGLLVALTVLPPRTLRPFSTKWLYGDLFQVWSAYRGHAQWPSLITDRWSYPLPLNLALFDPMPIVLWFSEIYRPDLGRPYQLFGAYFVLCLILQGLFGALLVHRALDHLDSPKARAVLAALGGALIAGLPFTFFRFTGHTALSSQWIIVLSCWAALSLQAAPSRRWLMVVLPLIAFATGINPYITLLACIPLTAFSINEAVSKALPWTHLVLRLFAVVVVVAIGLYVFGFTAGVRTGGSSATQLGYGVYSMNLFGPIDGNGLAKLWKLDVPDPTHGQTFEGLAYVGLGLICLTCLVIVLVVRGAKHEPWKAAGPMAASIAVGYLLSLSMHVYASNSLVLDLTVPVLDGILANFRSSGRLFWVGGILLVPLLIGYLARLTTQRASLVVALMVVLVQAIDVSGVALDVRKSLNAMERYSAPKVSLTPETTALIATPPWQCSHEMTPGGVRGPELVGELALRYNLTTNSFYGARTPPEQLAFHCNESSWIGPDGPSKSTLYLVGNPPQRDALLGKLADTHKCVARKEYGGYSICRPRHGG